MISVLISGSDTWGNTLGDFLDNFEPTLDFLDLDTTFTHRGVPKDIKI